MSSTISATIATGVTLGAGTYTSPLTIASGGGVSYSGSGYAITGTGTLVNQGLIAQYGGTDGAVSLSGASSVTNNGTVIGSARYAVVLGGSGGISNYGLISGFLGVSLQGAGDIVTNLGTIIASAGYGSAVYLANGGTVINGASDASTALLLGSGGVIVGGEAAGMIANDGTIAGQLFGSEGVSLSGGGTVTNGASGVTLAQIQGYFAGIASSGSFAVQVSNYATISSTGEAQGSYGILIQGTGTITNIGTASLIEGDGGISIALNGNVSNDGIIAGTIVSTIGATPGFIGVNIQGTGTVTNTGTASLIEGYGGGIVIGSGGTVINAGTILALESDAYATVSITGNGAITNVGTASLIQGYHGVVIGGVGSITNAGSILGVGGANGDNLGVVLNDGGSVINGSTSDTTALVYGGIGVDVKAAAGTVINYATIQSLGGYRWGVYLADGGTIVNGGTADTQASIYGPNYGIRAVGPAATVTNFGSIGSSTNGVAGVELLGGGTVVDAGTITSNINAIYLGGSDNLLVLQPGYAINGSVRVSGSGNTLELQGSVIANYNSVGLNRYGSANFQTIAFAPDAGATLVIGSYAGFLGTIAGFTGVNDRIDLANLSDINNDASISFNAIQNQLTVSGDYAEIAVLQLAGIESGVTWTVTNYGTGTAILPGMTVNAAPTISVGGTATFIGGGPAVVLDGAIAVSDAESGNLVDATVWINSGSIAGDVLNYTSLTGLGITGSYDASTGTLTLSGTSSIENYESALDSVTFSVSPSNGDPTGGGSDTSRTIDWVVNDGTAVSNTGSSVLDTVHTAPTIAVSGTATFTGGGTAVALAPAVGVTDLNSGGVLQSATITILNFQTGDVLNYGSTAGITESYNAATGVLTLSGSDALAAYVSELESVTYSTSPANGDPTDDGSRTSTVIDWSLNDGVAASNTDTTTLDLVHAAPSVTAGGTVTFTGGGSAVVLDSTIGISDPDSGGNLTGATVWINGGSIAGDLLNDTSLTGLGITGSYDASTGTLALSGTSSIENYESALDSVAFSFSPSNGDPTGGGSDTTRIIDWSVTDGSASNGVSNTGTTTLDTVHVAPSVTAGGTVTFTGGGSAVVLDSAIAITDPDSGGNLTGARVWINSGSVAGDVLNYASLTGLGITGSYDASTGTLTLSGTSSIANYASALDSVAYSVSPSDGDPTGGGSDTTRVIDWSVTDGSTSNGVSNIGSSTLDTVHVPPTIAAGATATFDGGGSAVVLDSAIAVTDPDSGGNLVGATIWINNGSIAGDVLNYTSLTGLGITGSYDAGTGTLALSGTSSIANYESALDSVAYSFSPADGDPTGGGGDVSRSISWSVNDGAATSNVDSSTLDVVHIAPSVTASGTVVFDVGGTAVALDPGIALADPDSNDMLTGATLVIADGLLAGDALNFNTGSIAGTYNPGTGTLVLSGTASIAAYGSALAAITYSSNAADPSDGGTDPTRTITWMVTDGSSSNGISNIGTTAIDVVLPPAIGGTAADQPTNDETAILAFGNVTITDPNAGQTETIVVTMSNNANGTLSDNVGTGTVNNGTYVVTGTTLAVTQALDALVFTPTTHGIGPGDTLTTTFTVTATNSDGATASDSTTSVIATPVTPQITGTVPVQAVPAGTSVRPFGGVTVTDASPSGNDTVTVALSSASAGTLFSSVGGSFNPNSGVFSVSGSPAQVQNDLESLVFTPSASASAWLDTTTFTLDVTGPGGSIGGSVSVAETRQVLGLATGSGSVALAVNSVGGSFPAATPTDINEADVLNALSGGTYSLPGGYQAEFLGGSSNAILTDPSGGHALLAGNGGIDTISSGASGDTLIGAGAGSTMEFTANASGGLAFAPPGGVTMLDAGSHDTMLGSSGSTTATLTGANALFFGQAGTTTVSAGGASDTIVGGSGGTTLQFTAGATNGLAFGGSSTENFSDAGTGDTLVGALSGTKGTISGTSALFFAAGSTDSVSASGKGDSLVGGSSQSTFDFGASASNGVVFGGSGALSINDAGSNDTMLGGSVSTTAAISGTDALFFVEGGTTSVSASGHGDTLVGGSGQSTLQFATGATNGLLFGGTSTAVLSDAGSGDTLVGSNATTSVTLAGSDATFFAGIGTVSATDSGRNDTIAALGAHVAVTSSGSGLVLFGGSGPLAFTGGAHGATIVAGSGTASITGGSGGVTLFGGAGGAIDYSGSAGGLFYLAGSGNETLDASKSTTSNIMYGGSGPDSIIGGQGAGQGSDTMVAGSGNDTLVGNANDSGQDMFVFFSADGKAAPQDVVQNYTAGDEVLLAGYGATAAATALANASTNDGSVTLTLSDHTTITFADVASVSSLTGHVMSF